MGKTSLAAVLIVGLLGVVVPAEPAAAVAPVSAAGESAEQRALAEAAALNEPVEVAELTTETVRVTAQPDGTLEAESSGEPVRVRDGAGWRDLDTTLVRRPDGTVGPVSAASEISFSGGGNQQLVRLAEGPSAVRLDWRSTLPAPVLSGDKAMYPNVLPDVDLVVQAGIEGFSSYLVVKNATAAANPALAQLTFPVTSSQVTLGRTSDGGLSAADSQGRTVFEAPPARMWDSRSAPPEEGAPAPLALPPRDSFQAVVPAMGAREAVAAMAVPGGTQLTVTPDPNLLRGADTVYPVVIDPALSTAIKRKNWTMVWSNDYTFRNHPTEHARVGRDEWSPGPFKTSRVFYQLDTGALRGKQILKAVFRARQVHTPHWDCTRKDREPGVQLWRTGATSTKTTWDRQPEWQEMLAVNHMTKGHIDICGDPIDVEWNAERAVETAAANRWSVLTLGLRSEDESTKWGWRKYDNTSKLPVLTVRYNSPPTKPVGLTFQAPKKSCDSILPYPQGAALRPTLQATLTDPDRSGSLRARFEVWRNASPDTLVWAGSPAAVSPGQVTQITVGTSLQVNTPYFFRVRAEETQTDAGYGTEPVAISPWVAGCDFTLDNQRPPAPGVSSADYPANGVENGAVGRNGLFTLTRGAADVVSYRYRLNGGAWYTLPSSGVTTQLRLTPGKQGDNLLKVFAKDAAGLESVDADYLFRVAPGAPATRVWRFDDGTGATAADSSGWATKVPLTLVTGSSAPVWSAELSRLAGALQFDGVDDYATANQPAIETAGSFTLSTWVRMSDLSQNQTIAHQLRSDGRLGFLLFYSKTENRWAFQRGHSGGVVTIYSKLPPAGGAWTHLAATYDASEKQLRLYVNGVAQGIVDYPYAFDATGLFEVGRWRYSGVPGSTLRGRIDQLMLFNRQLTTEELNRLVRLSNTGDVPQPELAARWEFNGTPSDTTAPDLSGYGSTATLGEGATIESDPQRGSVLRVGAGLDAKAVAGGVQIDGTGSFTLMAHVKPEGPAYRGFVLAAGSHAVPGGYENYGLGLSRDDPDGWIFTRRNHVNDPATRATVSSAALEPEHYDNWVHLAAVYDSTSRTIALYRNGVFQSRAPFSAAWHSTGPIMIGGEIPGAPPTSTFAGLIDDVRVYSGALTEGQIGAECGLDCWWTSKLTDQEDE